MIRNTSENSSRISKWIAAVTLLAMMVAGAIYFAPRVWNQSAKTASTANSMRAAAAPPAVHQGPITQTAPSVSITPPTPKANLPLLSAGAKKETVASAVETLKAQSAMKIPAGPNERMQPDAVETDGENGEGPKQRANYFYYQRAYPNDHTPAGALQQSRQQLDAMIAQERAAGIIPAEGAADPLSVSFPGPANWTNIGPQPVTNSAGGANFGSPASTGRVTAIAVDPTTTTPGSQVVYLGAATGGVWKSTDGGASWNTIFDQNNSLAIGGIAIAPSDHNTIYVGTGELNFSGDSYYGAGIYKSTDGGAHWTQQCGPAGEFCAPTSTGNLGGGFYVGDIAVNPTNASIALAAVRDTANSALSGIYRTTDGGTTWALIASASGASGNSVVWNQTDNTIVYATLGEAFFRSAAGVYKSTDSGVTFTKLTGNGALNNNLPTGSTLGRHVLTAAPSNGSVVYVAIDNVSTSGLLGLGKSTDAGVTWTFTAPGTLPSLPNFCSGQCWYDMALAVLPNDPNTLVVGGSAFTNNSSTDFRTSDGGTTWTDITTGSAPLLFRPHVDTHAMTFAATTGGFRLYTGNDGGIWFTDNPTAAAGTLTWQSGNNANLTITQFYPGHSPNPSDENISYGGAQDNGTEKYSGILAWDHVTCGDGGWTAIDPVIPSTVYAGCQNVDIRKSTLDGVSGSWISINNEIPTSGERSLFIPPLVHDQNRSGWLYFGTFRVWQSQTYGVDWTVISPDLTGGAGDVTSVSVAPNHSEIVYATTSDGRVWRTTNATSSTPSLGSWVNLTKSPLPSRYATMVKADDSSPDIAYVAYSGFNGAAFGDTAGHIFKTTDGGTTWTDISGSGGGALPNTPVNDIAIVNLNSLGFNAVFIATDIGVFECSNPTAATPCQTWTPVGSGLPKVPVVGLAYRQNSAMLRAVTHGRGIWVMETPGISATGLLLLTSITPSSRPSGSGSFTMTFDGNDFGVPSGTPQILVDGVDPGVTNITLTNSNHMTATIPASVTANPGWHQITINQPGHAATPQNPTCCISFGVTGPAPTLTSISPTQTNTGSASFPLTLTGTGFICGATPAASLVQFGPTQISPSACSATSMTATIPSNLVSSPGSVSVKAFSPGPGGGSSSGQTFTIGSPATNDNFANAIAITSLPFTDTKSTGSATTEVGEPVPSSICIRALPTQSPSTHSIWYSYTPASSGVVSFSSPGESEAGIIQVVTGSALGALTPVVGGCSLDISSSFSVSGAAATVKVSAGVTYHIMLSDYNGTGGTAVLSAAAATPPINDDFASAATVSTVGFGDTRTTTGATTEVGEPIPAPACTGQQAASTHSVWYRYSPGSSGTAVFNTNGSSTDSIIQVVTGSLGGFAAVTGGCADNGAGGVGETVTFTVTSGTTYFIMVSDWNGIGGTSVLNFASGPAPTGGGTPDMTITKTHTGNFTQGQASNYTITVTNSGTAATVGTVSVVDSLPVGMTAAVLSGTGWTCTLGTITCTRSDALANGGSYPAITLTVNVATNAPASLTNSVTVSGGGETNTANDSASDLTTILTAPDLTITKTHVGNFSQGQNGALYTITVTNSGTGGATFGTVTVVDSPPAALSNPPAGTPLMSGTGWVCNNPTLTCTRSDALAAGASYPPITFTAFISNTAPSSVTNSVTVSGGSENNTSNDTASDPTTINPVADMTITKHHVDPFFPGQIGATFSIVVSNSGGGATSGTVTVVDNLPSAGNPYTPTAVSGTGWSCTLAALGFTCTRTDVLAAGASYPTITLTGNISNSAVVGNSFVNNATVSGGGEVITTNDLASDAPVIAALPDLTISKSHTGSFSQGQTGATYSIIVSNVGAGGTFGTVTVVDTLPTGLSATAMTGTGWTCTLGTLTCTRSDVLGASGAYPTITLTVNVAGNAPASVTNSVAVSGGSEQNTGNDSAIDPTTVTPIAPDMTITKTHVGSFTQGQVGATYTITATNSGGAATTAGVTVVDTLPAGLTATALTGTGWTCTLGTLTCTRVDALAPAASYPAITLTVTVANNAAASVTNNVTVSGGGETNTANDTATDPTTVIQVADLTITKSHTGSFSQGQVGATYSITVSNAGPGPTSGTVTVVDTVPVGLTATALTGTGWTCTLGTFTCTRADVLAAAGSYPAITLTVTVSSSAASSVTNTATVSGGGELNTANDVANDVTTITQASDLTITKTHVGSFTQGQVGATYTITATNNGPGPTNGTVTVVDTLPAGLTATAIAGTGWTCTLGTLTCTRADVLAATSSYPAITLTVTVAANAAASVTNNVTISGGGEINLANDAASDPTTVIQVADLTITKSHSGSFTQGQVGATYSIAVSNGGFAATSGTVTVVDTLPTGLTATAISGTGWTCTLGTLTCTRVDALATAASYPAITVTVTVANNAAASVTNSVTVSGGGETNVANDTALDPTTVIQVADLTVTKTHVGSFAQGQVGATYSITVSNAGPGPTTGTVTMVDTIPAGLTATALAGTGWTCTVGTLTCTRADVLAAAGSYPVVTLTVTVAGNAATSVTNAATVSGGGELNTANDVANDVTTIALAADLSVTKTHVGSFTQGQVGATYTITATNNGPGPTTGLVTVVDTLPAGLTATAMAGTGWTCVVATTTCTRSDVLAATASYPAITLTVTVAANAAAIVTNNVAVSGGGEINVANDTATDPTTIIQVADLTIIKTHVGNFTQGQVGATYAITVTNGGAGSTAGTVTVVDTLPAGLTATALSGTGWTCTLGTLTCTRADVLAAAGSYPAITLTVTVANNAAASVTNTATVSGGGELNVANDVATNPTTITQLADMTITKTHAGSFILGQTGATYTITATNGGAGPTSGTVTVVDTLPAGLTATAMSGTGWTCTLGTLTCTRADVLAAATSYPAITLTVTVGTTAGNVTNTATVSGGGEVIVTNDTANDVTALIQDFAETSAGGAVTVTAGQTAMFTITVTPGPGGFSSPITFTASGLPAASIGTFNPTSVTPGNSAATTVFSVATTAHSTFPGSAPPSPWKVPQFAWWSFAFATLLLSMILFGRTGGRRRLTPAMFVTVALLLAVGITGCSSASGTPAGTSTITVTATSGAISHSTTVTLTVQ